MKSWQAFFLFLAICGFAAGLIPWVYHQSQTLTVEDLTRNADLWRSSQPDSYTLRVFVDENGIKSTWVFRIEEKQTVAVSENGHFQTESKGGDFLPPSVFEQIRQWLKYKNLDPKPPYVTASFHPQWGYPLRAVLRRKKPSQRLEIQMILELHKS